jgi:CheY-like chemotaxis protein
MHEALKSGRLFCRLAVVDDGEAALEYLWQRGPYESAPRPDLVLLDLNLPKKNGMEVLSIVKSDATLRSIPVVVLTTSDRDEDVVKSYALHANCYIRKPPRLEDFMRVVQTIDDFWLTIVRLPPKGPPPGT